MNVKAIVAAAQAIANPKASSDRRRAPVALTFSSEHRRVLAERLAEAPAATIIGLCAAWCDTCLQFRPSFERLAEARRDALFVWLDIEDDSAVVGDIDVENFPSLAVFRRGVPVFFGATSPQEGVVDRLLAALARGEPVAVPVPDEVAALPRTLARLVELPGPEPGDPRR